MSDKYYKVKLNNGDNHIVYANDDELESMVNANIISEYVTALDNYSTSKIYHDYICDELEEKAHAICYQIQKAKGITDGDCPPDLHYELDEAIDAVSKIIMKIIAHQEYVLYVDNGGK